jgi:transposase
MLFHYQIRNYYLYAPPTDMRKGMYSLCGLVNNELKKDPLSGDLFIFISRRKNQLKMLHWQQDGFGLFCKRLERGTYEIPDTDSLTGEQLLFLLQGVVLKSVKKRKRYSHDYVSNLSLKQ